ncbi:MAG: phosphoribosylglycinamide formyltransferase [Pseudomonadales bacterium]|nr:phosphoribosylglycinamide formyltransferase [Pseudomonadales bacterium]
MVVLISGSGTNLQAIINGVESGAIPGRIAAVLSNKTNVKGLERAEEHGIPTIVLDHKAYDSRESFDQAMIDAIDEHNPNLVVLAGFMRILTEEFVNHYAGKLINIHPSLLPKFKGLNTHQRALDEGEAIHGCSVHYVTFELDGGPIIGQRSVAIETNDTADLLAARVQKEEHILYPLACKLIMEGRLSLEKDGPHLDGNLLPATGQDFSQLEQWEEF